MTAALLSACDPKVVIGYDTEHTERDAQVEAPALDAQLDTPDAMIRGPLSKLPWPSGTHATHEPERYAAFSAWRGRPVDIANLYVDRNSWSGLTHPTWPIETFADFAGTLVLTEPLYPLDQGNNADCAKGAYDGYWKKLGEFLIAHDRPDTILRLGWGMNDPGHHWRSDADPSAWIACFRNVVSAVRATNPRIRIDWSFDPLPSAYPQSGDPYDAYPGDAYVDIVGMDLFDRAPATQDEAAWAAKCEGALGVCRLLAFAREHRKQLAFGEWGVASCGSDAGGDNPFYVRKMFELFQQNGDILAYESYFDEPMGDVCSGLIEDQDRPLSSAEYRRLYAP